MSDRAWQIKKYRQKGWGAWGHENHPQHLCKKTRQVAKTCRQAGRRSLTSHLAKFSMSTIRSVRFHGSRLRREGLHRPFRAHMETEPTLQTLQRAITGNGWAPVIPTVLPHRGRGNRARGRRTRSRRQIQRLTGVCCMWSIVTSEVAGVPGRERKNDMKGRSYWNHKRGWV
jgi:hypothetical protein